MPFVIRHMFASFPELRDFWGRCGVLGWLGVTALSCQIEGSPWESGVPLVQTRSLIPGLWDFSIQAFAWFRVVFLNLSNELVFSR